eukprot:6200246-Prymnesium_polylepis.1
MGLMCVYRTGRGPGLTPLVPGIVAGRGRGRWRGLCPVRPRGCAWRTYAPRPRARRRHRPRPRSLCTVVRRPVLRFIRLASKAHGFTL